MQRILFKSIFKKKLNHNQCAVYLRVGELRLNNKSIKINYTSRKAITHKNK